MARGAPCDTTRQSAPASQESQAPILIALRATLVTCAASGHTCSSKGPTHLEAEYLDEDKVRNDVEEECACSDDLCARQQDMLHWPLCAQPQAHPEHTAGAAITFWTCNEGRGQNVGTCL